MSYKLDINNLLEENDLKEREARTLFSEAVQKLDRIGAWRRLYYLDDQGYLWVRAWMNGTVCWVVWIDSMWLKTHLTRNLRYFETNTFDKIVL